MLLALALFFANDQFSHARRIYPASTFRFSFRSGCTRRGLLALMDIDSRQSAVNGMRQMLRG